MPALVPMDANDLLAVSPKLLAQAILHRRERIAEIEKVEEDIKQGMIKPEYGEYYVTWLEQSETILIEFHNELITD